MAGHLAGAVRDMPPADFAATLSDALQRGGGGAPALHVVEAGATGDVRLVTAEDVRPSQLPPLPPRAFHNQPHPLG
jgi:hypothetical protein